MSETRDPNKMLWVEIREMKPNRMFDEWQRQSVRGLVYNRPVPCAVCGKKKRGHWTMLCEFKAVDFGRTVVVAVDYPQILAPLMPVCSAHPLHPAYVEDRKEGAK